MARLEQVKPVKEVDQRFLSVIFDKNFSKKELAQKERSKVAVFEKGLASELLTGDTVEQTVLKIVKMALACEFGPSLVAQSGAKKMVETISRGILCDSELRHSALIIADRFAGEKKRTVALRSKNISGKQGKTIING